MRRTFFFVLISFLAVTFRAEAAPLELSANIHQSSSLPYTPHHGPGAFDSYVAMDLPYTPLHDLLQQVDAELPHPLKSRGEAHITVITPPEYFETLRSVLSIDEIDQIVTARRIQSAKFTPLCLGRAVVAVNGKPEAAFYVVVASPELVKIRKAIFNRFVAKGGKPSLFDPRAFFPHVTLGYTLRDLHESDGVRKSVRTCVRSLRMKR